MSDAATPFVGSRFTFDSLKSCDTISDLVREHSRKVADRYAAFVESFIEEYNADPQQSVLLVQDLEPEQGICKLLILAPRHYGEMFPGGWTIEELQARFPWRIFRIDFALKRRAGLE